MAEPRPLRPGPLKSLRGQHGPKWTDGRPLSAPPEHLVLPPLSPRGRGLQREGLRLQPCSRWPAQGSLWHPSGPLQQLSLFGALVASGAMLILEGSQALAGLREVFHGRFVEIILWPM